MTPTDVGLVSTRLAYLHRVCVCTQSWTRSGQWVQASAGLWRHRGRERRYEESWHVNATLRLDIIVRRRGR